MDKDKEYEKLGVFYLGRPYDAETRSPQPGLLLYDSQDLVTHAVIIGMTGSGKTGLGIGLLEEAALDGVPAIAIDPKGDLGNLLLTFPNLAPEDFRPWINLDDAARQGQSPEAFAADQAARWKEGLAAWDQDPERIARLRRAVDLAIYTPGSGAGLGVSIMKSFARPAQEVLDDHELLAERLSTSVSGLLTLVGVDADPVRSREHILLSSIIGAGWKAGQDLDLAALIAAIQHPPVSRIGVLDVDSFFPAQERFDLALRLNGLLAAPGFAAWLEGEPLDVDRLLYTAAGRPRIAVMSIAHLGDAERMFFVALLLNEIVGWMRKQAGTTSLRALVYMDEVAGYMPPVATPPSKRAFLTLLKQARAFGVGVVVATQNPVDLDYKGLSNAGTWFLGRLQTEQDKARVLDGLEGVLAGRGGFDRARMDRLLSGLGKRVFLLHNVHEDAPQVFETRWAMSYLRGPLTREQIRTLMAPLKTAPAPRPAGVPAETASGPPSAGGGATPSTAAVPPPAAVSVPRPVLPPDVPQYFMPAPSATRPHYEAQVWAAAQIEFSDTKLNVRESRQLSLLAPIAGGPVGVDWARARVTDLEEADLETEPGPGATFGAVPPEATRARSYAGWRNDLVRWLLETQQIDLFRVPDIPLTSTPGEDERAFRIRLQLAVRERRDAQKVRLQQRYAPKVAALEERVRRAEATVEREQAQASQQKVHSMFSVGATVLGALLGRKVVSATNLGKAATAARGLGRAGKEAKDVERAEDTLDTYRSQLAAMEAELQAELAGVDAGADALTMPLERVSIKPKKSHIAVHRLALLWTTDGPPLGEE
jgi:hypothetical protein